MKQIKAVQISDVVENGPAQRAGLRAGDEIRQIDGQQVSSYRDVIRAINNKSPDDQVQITIIRNGEQQQLNVALAQQQNVFDQATRLAQRLRNRLNEREAGRQDDRRFQDRARDWQDEQNRGDVAQNERRYQDRPLRQYQYDERDRFDSDRRTARREDRQERLDSMDRDAQRRDDRQWRNDNQGYAQNQWRSDSQARDQWQSRDRRWQGREREERATLGIGVRPSSGTVWVTQVYQGSAAEQAGIRRGDQIVAIDGQSIRSYGQLSTCWINTSVELNRDGIREQLHARLQDGEAYARQSQQSEQYRTRGDGDYQSRDQQYRDADQRDRSYQSDDRYNQQRAGSRRWEADRKATGDAFDGEPSDNSDVESDNRDF